MPSNMVWLTFNHSFIKIQITIKSDKLKFSIVNKKSILSEPDAEHSGCRTEKHRAPIGSCIPRIAMS